VFVPIIDGFTAPHSECDLDPGIGKTPVRMLGAFTLITSSDILLLSPVAFVDGALGKLLEGVPAQLVSTPSEAHIEA
jgi:hypothetical protein